MINKYLFYLFLSTTLSVVLLYYCTNISKLFGYYGLTILNTDHITIPLTFIILFAMYKLILKFNLNKIIRTNSSLTGRFIYESRIHSNTNLNRSKANDSISFTKGKDQQLRLVSTTNNSNNIASMKNVDSNLKNSLKNTKDKHLKFNKFNVRSKKFLFMFGFLSFYVMYKIYASPISRYEHNNTNTEYYYRWTVFFSLFIIYKMTQIKAYSLLPFRFLSFMFGTFNSITLPVFMRPYLFRLYAYLFNCNLDELKVNDLTKYTNLKQFFMREINSSLRPIDNEAVLVSPCDGKVLHFGKIQSDRIEQIKGHSYSILDLVGKKLIGQQNMVETTTSTSKQELKGKNNSDDIEIVSQDEFSEINDIQYSIDDLLRGNSERTLLNNKHTFNNNDLVVKDKKLELKMNVDKNKTEMFFSVIYLAPGDYHRFHSPANWIVYRRRHFAGELYSVSPKIIDLIPNLFVLNERIVLMGRWRYGRFVMAPIGATNVGTIKINFDQHIKRSKKLRTREIGTYSEVIYKNIAPDAINATSAASTGHYLKKGEEMGAFSLGSTILLIFEAPKNFEFKIKKNQKIKYGQAMGLVPETKESRFVSGNNNFYDNWINK